MKPFLAGVVTLALGACAALPVPPPASPDEGAPSHAARVAAFDDWQLRGRVAVQRADQGMTADLDWRQRRAGGFDLRVMAPLSGGTFLLAGDARSVTLTTAAGDSHVAPDAEALMRQHLGWSLPLGGARYWVRGIPAPSSAATQEHRDADGRWSDFAQDGWRVSILDYVAAEGLDLPRKLFLTHDDLQVRMVISRWERR